MTERGAHLDDLSLEDLCKPISALVQPRYQRYFSVGINTILTDAEVRAGNLRSSITKFYRPSAHSKFDMERAVK